MLCTAKVTSIPAEVEMDVSYLPEPIRELMTFIEKDHHGAVLNYRWSNVKEVVVRMENGDETIYERVEHGNPS